MPHRYANLLVISLLFLGPPYVVAGNVAREDALTLALVCLGFLLHQRGKPYASLAITGLGVVVHPNAIYYFLALGGCTALSLSKHWRRPSTFEWTVILPCVAATAISAAFVLRHWNYFLLDFWGLGLAAQASRNPLQAISQLSNLLICGWVSILFSASLRWDRRWLLVLLFGLCSLLPPLLNREMWYAIYRVTGFGMLALTSVHFITMGLVSRLSFAGRRWREAIAILTSLPFLYYSWSQRDIEGPHNYPYDMEWKGGGGMAMQTADIPWITDEDIDRVTQLILDKTGPHTETVIEFSNYGCDSVFFKDALDGYRIIHPVYTSFGGDIIVFHVSRYHPTWVRNVLTEQMKGYGIDPEQPIYMRDTTEKWYIQHKSAD